MSAALSGTSPVSKTVQAAASAVESREVKVELARRLELDPDVRDVLTRSGLGDVSAIAKLAPLESFDGIKIADIRQFLTLFPEVGKDRAIAAYEKNPRPTLESAIVLKCPQQSFTDADIKTLISKTKTLSPDPRDLEYLVTYDQNAPIAQRLFVLAESLGEDLARELCLDPETTPEGLSYVLVRPLPQDALEVALRRFLQEVIPKSPHDPAIHNFLAAALRAHGRTSRLKPFKCPPECPCSTQAAGSCYTQLREIRVLSGHQEPLTRLTWSGSDEIHDDPVGLIEELNYSLAHGERLGFGRRSLARAFSSRSVPRAVIKQFAKLASQSHRKHQVRSFLALLLSHVSPTRFADDLEILEAWRIHAPLRLVQDLGYEPFGGPEKVAELVRNARGSASIEALRNCPPSKTVLRAMHIANLDDLRKGHRRNTDGPYAGWSDALLEIVSEELMPNPTAANVATLLLEEDSWRHRTLGEAITTVQAILAQ